MKRRSFSTFTCPPTTLRPPSTTEQLILDDLPEGEIHLFDSTEGTPVTFSIESPKDAFRSH